MQAWSASIAVLGDGGARSESASDSGAGLPEQARPLHRAVSGGRFSGLVIDIAPTSREEFGQFMRAETERWARVIREAKIPMQ